MDQTPESPNPYDAPQGAAPFESSEFEAVEPETNKDARTWAMLSHLLAIPLGIFGPLICWLVKKDEHPFVDDQGKESLNFQITILIAALVSGASIFACIGVALLPAVMIFDLVMCIIATMKANEGQRYRYPLTLRLIK